MCPLYSGHNGAGKTTTISILTGMIRPTAGSATVCGRSILTEMGKIRESLGVCPQFDILWPEITVWEHLQIYASIKGYTRAASKRVAAESARDVGARASSAEMRLCLLQICPLVM
jgi:ATP-binding cassette subfamily A (ABC1) protein 3